MIETNVKFIELVSAKLGFNLRNAIKNYLYNISMRIDRTNLKPGGDQVKITDVEKV